MKKIIFVLITICFIVVNVFAGDIAGHWFGMLNDNGTFLKLVVKVKKSGDFYIATLDSPFQASSNIPVTSFIFEDTFVKFKVVELAIEYNGYMRGDGTIKGVFEHNGTGYQVELSKEDKGIVRQQDPAKPYPYIEQNVLFENKEAKVELAGTLTLPENIQKSCPAVVLISDSGAHDRNEDTFGHKPFLIIADHLTKNGFAVLRYDDRGTASSSGEFKSATTADFASDAKAAIEYLKTRKEIDKKSIGLIGHGEGAAIASMIASEQKETAFIVLLAGSGINGGELLLKQQKMTGKAMKIKSRDLKRELRINKKAIEIVSGNGNIGEIRSALTEYIGKTYDGFEHAEMPRGTGKADYIRIYLNGYANPWMRSFLTYNPADALAKVQCPVLALCGSRDLQVAAKVNLKAIKKVLHENGNENITTKMFPELNHFFQESKTGLPSEYAQIEQTFSVAVLSDMLKWIQKTVNNN